MYEEDPYCVFIIHVGKDSGGNIVRLTIESQS